MSAEDPRLDEIQAIPAEAVEAAARGMAILDDHDGCFLEVDAWNAQEEWEREAYPEDYPGSAIEDCAYWIAKAHAAIEAAHPALLAELRKAHEALERVEALHQPVKIYDECDCPDGTHPDEYDYIDCEDYVGCENSLSGVGCQECCVDSWDSLTQECGENHSHSKDPAFRCDTIKALRAAVAAANGDEA